MVANLLDQTDQNYPRESSSYHPATVLLVYMPFGVPGPSLALSLLKSALVAKGIRADLHYFSLDYLARVGIERYLQLCNYAPTWFADAVFRRALWGEEGAAKEKELWARVSVDQIASCLELPVAEIVSTFDHMQRDAVDFIEECAGAIDWRKYQIIGFTSTFQQSLAALALAKRIPERSAESAIVFGGANCEAEMGFGLLEAFPFIDYVFSGPSEDTFPEFVVRVLKGERVSSSPGILARGQDGEPIRPAAWISAPSVLDSLPFPDFDDYVSRWRELGLCGKLPLTIPFEGSRGCWWGEKHQCTFCGLNGSSMAFRSKSADCLIAELEYQVERYSPDVARLSAVDNILDMRYFKDVIPRLGEVRKGASIFYEVKSNLSREQVEALAKAGVTAVQPGIESLDTDVLRLMDKGCSRLINIRFLKWCIEFGIDAGWNILYGFPGEQPASYKECADLIPALTHLRPPASIAPFRLDRFSPYFASPAQYGLTNVRPHRIYQYLHDLPASMLEKIAYFFEFNYADGRDLRYGDATEKAVEEWREETRSSVLIGFVDEQQLLIWDTRPVAVSEWSCLQGPYRDVLLQCDDIRGEAALRRSLTAVYSEPEITDCLRTLAQRRLLIADRGSWLSVVVLARRLPAPAVDPNHVEFLPARPIARPWHFNPFSSGKSAQGEQIHE